MTTYCRLCAESKPEDELSSTINDSKLNIKEKLVVCCQWNNYSANTQLPDSVCYSCVEKLEKSWLFNECIALAQIKLQEIFNEVDLVSVKSEPNVDDEFPLCDNPEDIFVEEIMLPEPNNEDDKPLVGVTIESLEEAKPRQLHECDECQKSFTTAYNLTVCLLEFHLNWIFSFIFIDFQ